jgi:mRNA-degrading endonuclease RelE of RelBE toxin-antitoxin system
MAAPRKRSVDDGEKQDKLRAQQQRWKALVFGFGLIITTVLLALGLLAGLRPTNNDNNDGSMPASSLRAVPPENKDIVTTVVTPSSVSVINQLEAEYKALDAQVRKIKATKVIMETDPKSQRVTKKLQEAAKKLLKARYGDYPTYRVKMELEFQPSIPDYATNGKDGTLVIEMAPVDLIPVSVFTFLEVARTWKRGSFHRNAGHVLQAQVNCGVHDSLPFQEYSPQYPHKKGTTGYCGRPSGPCFYISIMDNTENHGPGSQQDHNPYEADANFGRVVEGFDTVVPRIHSTPQKSWLDEENRIYIRKMHVLVPDGNGSFRQWKEAS